MSWLSRFADSVRRTRRAGVPLPNTILRTGMERFRQQTALQLLETSMRVPDDDPLMSAVCDGIRVEKRDAIDNIIQAHRRRVTDGELRTIVGELVGIQNVEVRLMAWIDKGRAEAEKTAARQQKGKTA